MSKSFEAFLIIYCTELYSKKYSIYNKKYSKYSRYIVRNHIQNYPVFFLVIFLYIDTEASKVWLWTSRYFIKRFTVSAIILSFWSSAIPQVKACSSHLGMFLLPWVVGRAPVLAGNSRTEEDFMMGWFFHGCFGKLVGSIKMIRK